MMKALIKEKDQVSYEYKDIPKPSPKKGEVLIKMEAVAICGSDIPLYKWDEIGKTIATLPFVPGHECAGTILEVGEGVTDLKIGDRVCCETHLFCSECLLCKMGKEGLCAKMGLYGHGVKTLSGGCSQFSTIAANAVYKLKSNIPFRLAAILEPFGVAYNACEEIPIKDEVVLVSGAGPIGLFACGVAKYMGAKEIVLMDIVEDRLKIGTAMGATHLINSKDKTPQQLKAMLQELTGGYGVGAVVECSGAPVMVNNSFSFLRKAGAVVLIGLPKQPLHVENVLNDFIFKAITVKTVHGRKLWSTWEESEKLLANKLVDVEPVISHELPMSKYEEAFRVLLNGEASKIIMNPQN